MELDSDVFENILGLLGPRDLVAVACVGPAFGLNLEEEVLRTEVMEWSRVIANDVKTLARMLSTPESRYLSGEKSNGQPFSHSSACKFAAATGNLKILKLLRADDFPWSPAVTAHAAFGGHIETLTWAHENGCVCDEWTMDCAGAGGDLVCAKYLRENGCPWDIETSQIAASLGRLEFLKYGRQHGCPWDADTCVQAAMHGHLDCLKYAHENGCEWDVFTPGTAAVHNQLSCLVYALENGCPRDAFVSNCAIIAKNLVCLKYAYEHGCGWNEASSKRAVESGDIECFKYAVKNGCEWCPIACEIGAEEYGHFRLASWLKARLGSMDELEF